MANRVVRERLVQDVSLWLIDGLVTKDTHDLLRQRYGAKTFGLGQIIKSLGIAGALFAALGLMGLVAAFSKSEGVAGFLLAASGVAFTAGGIWLATDKLGRYSISSKTLQALGVLMAVLGIGVCLNSLDVKTDPNIFFTGILVLAVVGFLAYRYRITFLLVLGLIIFFHWVGTWSQMAGRSTYEIDIQDPRIMCLAALAAIGVGMYHERFLREQTGRFYQAYETMGLIYLNLSLLILSIFPGYRSYHWDRAGAGVWIAALTVASLAEIVSGALLHNPLLTGFGVTTLVLDGFTRYFENFWDTLPKGAFFLVGGAALFAAGVLCELALRKQRAPA